MMPKPAADISETEAFVDGALLALAQRTELHLVICQKDTGEFLGICGLHGRDDVAEPELGIWIKEAAHGFRYGLEAVDALVSWASESLDCDQFIYPVDRRNASSRAIAERLDGGLIREIKAKNMSGRILEEVVYGIPLKSTGENPTEQ